MSRFPIVFAQTVAFAAATGSITWQVLRILLETGTGLGPLAIALWITAGFAAGALAYALTLAPLQARLGARARLRGNPWKWSFLLLQMGIAAVWSAAWAIPGMRLIGMGGAEVFYGITCFTMGGLGGVVFYPRTDLGRTPV